MSDVLRHTPEEWVGRLIKQPLWSKKCIQNVCLKTAGRTEECRNNYVERKIVTKHM
jgi:hypothetical protein